MHLPICRDRPSVLVIAFLVGVSAGTPTPSTAASERDAQAMATLQRMADFLSQAQRFSVTAEIGFDVDQESGEKLEFGETRQIVIRRPDQTRIDITIVTGPRAASASTARRLRCSIPENMSTPRLPSLAPWTRPSLISSTTWICGSPWLSSSLRS